MTVLNTQGNDGCSKIALKSSKNIKKTLKQCKKKKGIIINIVETHYKKKGRFNKDKCLQGESSMEEG